MAGFNNSQSELIKFIKDLSGRKTTNCLDCSKPLSLWERWFLGRSYFCKECYQRRLQELNQGIAGYTDKILKAVKDGRVSLSEANELKEIQDKFGLSDFAVKKFSVNIYQKLYQEVVSDQRVNEEEEEAIKALCNQLGIPAEEISLTQRSLARLRLLTQLEEGVLPETQADILLQKKEIAHYTTFCELFEERVKREYVGGHSGFSIRIAKGIYWRVGGFKGYPVEKSVLTKIDQGKLVVTNKRIVFSGGRKSFSVPYSKLIDIELFKDAVKLNREGKSAREYFGVSDPEVLAKIITLAFNQS